MSVPRLQSNHRPSGKAIHIGLKCNSSIWDTKSTQRNGWIICSCIYTLLVTLTCTFVTMTNWTPPADLWGNSQTWGSYYVSCNPALLEGFTNWCVMVCNSEMVRKERLVQPRSFELKGRHTFFSPVYFNTTCAYSIFILKHVIPFKFDSNARDKIHSPCFVLIWSLSYLG